MVKWTHIRVKEKTKLELQELKRTYSLAMKTDYSDDDVIQDLMRAQAPPFVFNITIPTEVVEALKQAANKRSQITPRGLPEKAEARHS